MESPSSSFPQFLEFPLELRREIYKLCLVSPSKEPVCAGAPGQSVTIGLLRVSRQIHQECADIFIKGNTFTFGPQAIESGKLNGEHLLGELSEPLSKIKSWEIDVNCLSGNKGLENAYQMSLGLSGGEYHDECDEVRRFLRTQAQGKSVLYKIHVGKHPKDVNDRLLFFIPAANSIRSFAEGEKRHGFRHVVLAASKFDREKLNRVLRAVFSVKGTCKFGVSTILPMLMQTIALKICLQ